MGHWADMLSPDVIRYRRDQKHSAPPGHRWVRVTRKPRVETVTLEHHNASIAMAIDRGYEAGHNMGEKRGREAALEEAEKACRDIADVHSHVYECVHAISALRSK